MIPAFEDIQVGDTIYYTDGSNHHPAKVIPQSEWLGTTKAHTPSTLEGILKSSSGQIIFIQDLFVTIKSITTVGFIRYPSIVNWEPGPNHKFYGICGGCFNSFEIIELDYLCRDCRS